MVQAGVFHHHVQFIIIIIYPIILGKRLYELFRAGVIVEKKDRPSRNLLISSLEIVDYKHPLLILDVVCSKGTYIRQLIVDVRCYF
jgi:tRNA pseudouridine55 synthase